MTKMEIFAAVELLRKLREGREDSLPVRLRKAIGLIDGPLLKEGMSAPRILQRFPHLRDQLVEGMNQNITLMYIDLSPFSQVVIGWPPRRIKDFLDHYYRIVVDAITQYGGVVEKYIGDAVLAIIGEPFCRIAPEDATEHSIILAAYLIEQCNTFFDEEVFLKVAISQGLCFLGYVGHDEHRELTVVGNPLTELFRIEEECEINSIMLTKSQFDAVSERFTIYSTEIIQLLGVQLDWIYLEKDTDLRGVGFTRLSCLRKL